MDDNNKLVRFLLTFFLGFIGSFIINNTNLKPAGYRSRTAAYFFLTLVTFGIYGWWLEIKMLKWQSKNIHIKTVGEKESKDSSLWIAIPIAIGALILFSLVVTALGNALEDSNITDKLKDTFKFDNNSSNSRIINTKNVKHTVYEVENNY